MVSKIVEYRVPPPDVEPVVRAIRTFLSGVRAHEPETVYESFQGADGWFVHFMVFPDEAAAASHREAAYTKRFVRALYPRCIDPPLFTAVERLD